MKILFDEGVPRQLRRLLARDDITLVEEKGWKGVKNGRLLQLAEEDRFDALVTADQNLKYQQNLKGRKIAIVVLTGNRWRLVQRMIRKIVAAVNNAEPGSYTVIEIALR